MKKHLAIIGASYLQLPLIEKAKEEFAKQMNGKTYKCPIPKEIPVPQPQV